MFEKLRVWLGELVNWILQGLLGLLNSLIEQLRAFGDLVIAELLDAVVAFFPDLSDSWSEHEEVIGQINVFFPLSETVTMAIALVGLWATVKGYRFLKGWIFGTSS